MASIPSTSNAYVMALTFDAEFTIEHRLNWKVDGLVHERHDATADTLIYLEAQAFQPSVCSHTPMVNESNPCGHLEGDKGIRGFWGMRRYGIDLKITSTICNKHGIW